MRNIIDKHKDIENKIKILENTLEDFNDVDFRNKMINDIKKKNEENLIIREEEQKPLKKFLEKHRLKNLEQYHQQLKMLKVSLSE